MALSLDPQVVTLTVLGEKRPDPLNIYANNIRLSSVKAGLLEEISILYKARNKLTFLGGLSDADRLKSTSRPAIKAWIS